MGSGTTGVAAIECGRCFVGYEIAPAYQEQATQRIEAAQMDLDDERTAAATDKPKKG